MKTFKIILLAASVLVLAFLVVLLVLFISGKVNFSTFFRMEKQIVLLERTEALEGISGIKLDLSSMDVVITPSDSDEISMTYRGPESLKDDLDLSVEVIDGNLVITQEKQFYMFLFSWCFTPRVLEINLPESYADAIELEHSSGDVSISGTYQLSDFSANISSGDIRIENISCGKLSLHGSSGDISLGTINADQVGIYVTSGNIKADSITGDGKIGTTSGGVSIGVLQGEVDVDVTSGSIKISAFSGSGNVDCTSGSISMTVSNALGDLSVKTISGDVSVTFDKDIAYVISARCTSGDIHSDFAMMYSSDDKDTATLDYGVSPVYKLTLRTTSGDIALSEK